MTAKHITRHKSGGDFRYEIDGKIPDAATLERIDTLVIPPAWKDVKIAASPRSKVQAEGFDAAGRKQYIYHPSHRAKQEAKKFDRITSFATALPQLRKQLAKDLSRRRYDKRKVLACAISLMDEAFFRVGNEQYARNNQSYGLTTLRSKHIAISGDTITFDFVGKSGQQQHKVVNDSQIARIVKRLDDMPGYELFRYYDKDGDLHNLTSADINAYIKDIMGDEYSAKDFRTWGGTLLAVMELAKTTRSDKEIERNKEVAACVKKVAKRLGNTPAVARSSYIDPRIFSHYHQSDTIKELHDTIQSMKPQKYLSHEERCVMKLLT